MGLTSGEQSRLESWGRQGLEVRAAGEDTEAPASLQRPPGAACTPTWRLRPVGTSSTGGGRQGAPQAETPVYIQPRALVLSMAPGPVSVSPLGGQRMQAGAEEVSVGIWRAALAAYPCEWDGDFWLWEGEHLGEGDTLKAVAWGVGGQRHCLDTCLYLYLRLFP